MLVLATSLVLNPSLLDFGRVAVGTSTTATVTLEAAEGEVTVQSVEVLADSPEAAFDAAAPPRMQVDGTEQITLSFSPDTAGKHRGTLVLTSDADCGQTASIEVRGLATAPCAQVLPPELDFGEVLSPSSAVRSVTVTSCDDQGFVLDAAAVDSGAWSVTETFPIEVRPGGSIEIDLLFQPFGNERSVGKLTLRAGGVVGTAQLYANDCDQGDPRAYDTNDNGLSDCGVPVSDEPRAVDDDGDGWVEYDGDCDDADADVFPHAGEVENGKDDDCDGRVDEGHDDVDGDGLSAAGGDCDDQDPWVHPDEIEYCDGVDNDCFGGVDDGCTSDQCEAPRRCGCGGGDKSALWVLPLFLALRGRRWARVPQSPAPVPPR